MSDTPRTDAQTFITDLHNRGNNVVPAVFARKLEQELSEASNNLEARHNCFLTMREERDQWRECADNLVEAMDPANKSSMWREALAAYERLKGTK